MREKRSREFLVPKTPSNGLESPLIIAQKSCHHTAPLITRVRWSYYKTPRCWRRSAPWLTTPDRPAINDTLDIRLVIKSGEVRMIAVSILIKADAPSFLSLQPCVTFFFSFYLLYVSICPLIIYFLELIIFIPHFSLSVSPSVPCECVCPVCRLWGK